MNKLKIFIFITLSFLLNSHIELHAAWGPYITNYSIETYEGGSQNWRIIQGENGWLYFANNNGLLEFNGHNWQLHHINNGSIIRTTTSSHNGNIYVGAADEFGYFSYNNLNKLEYINLSKSLPDSLNGFREIWRVHVIEDLVYFQSRGEFFIFKDDKIVSHITSKSDIILSCVSNNSVYFTNKEGVYVITGDSYTQIIGSEKIPLEDVSAIESIGKNEIIIGTHFNGLYIYDGNRIKEYKTSFDKYLKDNQIYSIAYNKGTIAIGTIQKGIVWFDIEKKEPSFISIEHGLQNNTALSLFFDRDNILWIGLDNGISKIDINSSVYNFIGNGENESFTGYTSLLHNSHLYLGTNRGLYKTKYKSSFLGDRERLTLIENSYGQVWKLLLINNQLFCCHNRGLFRIVNNNFIPIYQGTGVWDVKPIDQNRFLLTTYNGFKLMKSNGSSYNISDIDGAQESIRTFHFSPQVNKAWIGSSNTIKECTFNHEYTEVKTKDIKTINSGKYSFFTYKGNKIIHTLDTAYAISNNGTFSGTKLLDSAYNDQTNGLSLHIDKYNNIWYYNDITLHTKKFINNNENNHIRAIVNNRRILVPGFLDVNNINDTIVIINNLTGFSIIDLTRESHPLYPKEPLIAKVTSTNNKDTVIYNQTHNIRSAPTSPIKIAYKNNSLIFEFGVNSPNLEGVLYSYTLDGVDHDWSEWSRSYTKEYTQLREGNYTMYYKIKDSKGRETSNSLEFRIAAPWYRTKIMYILYILLTILIGANLIQKYRRRYHNRISSLESVKNQELKDQKTHYISEMTNLENEMTMRINNEKLHAELKRKSAELNNIIHHTIEKNDIITNTISDILKIENDIDTAKKESASKRLLHLKEKLNARMIDNIDWGAFEENFDLVNDNFTQKLSQKFKWMSVRERRLCVYIKIGLQNKEIAPLLSISVRGVEMMRYRIRKKVSLDSNENLYSFFQEL